MTGVLNLSKLEHFCVLARSASFEQAARALRLTQPALSRSIQSLEAELGTVLLERQRGRAGVRLTETGRELLRQGETLLVAAESVQAGISSLQSGHQRRLAFGIGPMLASTSLSDPLLVLMQEYPSMEISVTIEDDKVMRKLLVDGDIEFYIGSYRPGAASQGVVRERFGSRAPGVFVRPGHPLLNEREVTPEMLAGYPRISGSAWNNRLRGVSKRLAESLRATVEIDNFELLVRVTLASDAVLMFAGPDRDRVLIPVDVALEVTPAPDISAFILSDRQLSPAARRLIDLLRTAYVDRPGEPPAV